MQDEPTRKSAVIYCRAASVMTSNREEAVESQERRCRETAAERDYDIVGVFHDVAVSGTSAVRPGMNELLCFLRDHPGTVSVVLVDHIGVLARSVATHLELRQRLCDAGSGLETTMARFGDDPDSVLAKALSAAIAEHRGDPFVENGGSRRPLGRSHFPERKR